MPATDYQGSSVPFASLGRSILSIRRDQVHANMDGHDVAGGDANDLESFQRHVTDLFADLAAADDLLSISWIRRLLDTFLVCQEEFRVILFNHRAAAGRPPLDRFISDFADRSVKALDVCNAIRDGIEQLRQWQKHLEIVLAALNYSNSKAVFGEGQLRRAKKALTDITILMLDEKEPGPSLSHRNRSFGRSGGSTSASTVQRSHFRSLSWSVSRSWSAARQLQAIGSNVSAPRSHEVVSTSGLAVPVYTMSNVLLFVMWALVAAIPCQDRGLHAHFSIPRSFSWAAPVMSLHERIVEESKKKDRKNSVGLLKEIHQIEKSAHQLIEVADSVQFPLAEEKETEVRDGVEEIAQVCEALKEGLKPLERQVREVFLRIVRSRTEGFDSSIHGSE